MAPIVLVAWSMEPWAPARQRLHTSSIPPYFLSLPLSRSHSVSVSALPHSLLKSH